jgi:hypothetical protein
LRIDQVFVVRSGKDSGIRQDMACHWLRGEVMIYMGRAKEAVLVANLEEVSL